MGQGRASDAGDGQAAAHAQELKLRLGELLKALAKFSASGELTGAKRVLATSVVSDVEEISARIERLLGRGESAPPVLAEREAEGPSASGLDRGRFRVLVVDDEAETREAMAELLSPYYEILLAADGYEGARRVQEARPDVVVTDLYMPHGDGLALLQSVRGSEETAQTPLLILSGLSDTDAKVRAFEAGAFDYLTKPISPGELIARIRNALVRSEDLRREQALKMTDDLTGLPNRRHLRAFLGKALKLAAESHGALTVAMLDQDGLKQINDRYGHARGDEAIRTVARALVEAKRETDCAARMGGDEFVVAMPVAGQAGALRLVARVEEELRCHPVVLEGKLGVLSVSFGVATFGDVGWQETAEQLLARADQALYEAKRASKHRGQRRFFG